MCIRDSSIPAEDADGDTDEGVIYKPLTRVTLAEVGAHVDCVSAQIVAVSGRRRDVRELGGLAGAAGATRDSLVLASLRGAPQRMREVAEM